jgi:hypothetical protein
MTSSLLGNPSGLVTFLLTAQIRRHGNAGCFGVSVVTNARVYYHYTRGCGCAGTRHSPRPHLGETFLHDPGETRRGIAMVCLRSSV